MRALLCLILPHARLGRLVHEENGELRSRCRRCGVALVKKDDHVWVRDRSVPRAGAGSDEGRRSEPAA